jgi:hypothetical protein
LRLNLLQAVEGLRSKTTDIQESVPLMGVVFVLLGAIFLGVRCVSSVAEENGGIPGTTCS